MSGKLLRSIFTLVLMASFGCTIEKNYLYPQQTGSITLQIQNPLYYDGTTQIAYSLTHVGFDSITDTIDVEGTTHPMDVFICNILIGYWDLTLEALDNKGDLLYSETIHVEILANETTPVEVVWFINHAGKAAYYDGDENYIQIANSPTLAGINIALTMEAWVRPIDQYYNYIINKGLNKYTMELLNGLRPAFRFIGLEIDYSNIENYHMRAVLRQSIPENEWTHLACTFNATMNKLIVYINGIKVAEINTTGMIEAGTEDLKIGGYISENYRLFYRGLIDEVRIWNVVRTQNQIQEAMSVELTGIESGLIGYWNFNELLNGNTVQDKSLQNNDGTVFGSIPLVTSGAF